MAVVKGLIKVLAVLLLVVVTLVVGLVGFFFVTPEFKIGPDRIRWALAKVMPATVELKFDDAQFEILRPENRLFAKYLKLQTKNLCVRYEGEAVDTCFADIRLGLAGGFSADRPEGAPFWMPQLAWIDPIVMTGGDVNVDVTKFPESEKKEEPSQFDLVEFLRKEVLPKWRIEGSHIEIKSMALKLNPDTAYRASFDLTTNEPEREIRAELREFAADGGPLRAGALIRLIRPENFLKDPGAQGEGPRIWKLFADGNVRLKARTSIDLKADADIESWRSLDFRIGTKFKGIKAIREARLEGALREALFNGKFSSKFGAQGSQVRALDFVNCGIRANVDEKTGALSCGPQTVRLQLQEKSLLQNRDFFTLAPAFELRLTRILFGDTKEADFEFDLDLDHKGIVKAKTNLAGSFLMEPEKDPRYSVEGSLEILGDKFQRIVDLLRRTPFAVPAPLNVLDGGIGLRAQANINEGGGALRYQLATRLDSRFQAIHLRFEGETGLSKKNEALVPSTNATLFIDRLRLSAPRFDLRVPPRFAPDARFGPIKQAKTAEKPKPREPMDFRLRVATTQPQAIQIATNLTKSAIPIDLDIVYNDRARPDTNRELLDDDARGSVSAMTSGLTNEVPVKPSQEEQARAQEPSPITGSIVIGRTPVDLFRRNAVLEELRLDLLESGQQRMNGQVTVHYLDYDIVMLVLGDTADPQVRFASDPPLEDDQILSVLLFGRPLSDLEEDQASSVRNLKSAFADAALGISSLYLLASTPIESVGYDPEKGIVSARVGLGGGASLELGGGSGGSSTVGFNKRLSRGFVFRSEVERLGTTGEQTVLALIEWVKRF